MNYLLLAFHYLPTLMLVIAQIQAGALDVPIRGIHAFGMIYDLDLKATKRPHAPALVTVSGAAVPHDLATTAAAFSLPSGALDAFHYAALLASIFEQIRGGKADIPVRGIRLGHDIYDLEILATVRSSSPASVSAGVPSVG